MKHLAAALSLSLSGLLGSGCFFSGDSSPGRSPPVVVGDGTLVLDWTINGVVDPAQCIQGGALTLDVVVVTTAGDFVGEFQEDCEVFATSIDLAPGRYAASAALLDASGADRTTAVDVRPFEIFGDDELAVSVDFPASSFY